jgi:hypothetical protein
MHALAHHRQTDPAAPSLSRQWHGGLPLYADLIVPPHAPWGFLDLSLEPVERCEASVSVSSEFRMVRRQLGNNPATNNPNSLSLFPEMYGPPPDCKGKAKSGSTGLRKCIRPSIGDRLGLLGHDELRCVLFLINGTVTEDHFREEVSSTPLGTVRSS